MKSKIEETITEKRIRLTEELKLTHYKIGVGWKGKDWIEYNPAIGEELYKPIPSFPHLYASNYGRIKNRFGKFMGSKDLPNKDSNTLYWKLGIGMKGKHISREAHRLVAETWLPDFHDKPIVDHRNGIGLDNDITNIRMSTHSDNRRNTKCYTNTGEKYIYYSPNKKGKKKYNLRIINFIDKWYSTLEEAVIARDKVLKENPDPFYVSNRKTSPTIDKNTNKI